MRMMRRQKLVQVVNRTLQPLEGLDDGIVITLKPGYRLVDGVAVGAGLQGMPEVETLPEATANRIINQNKAKGTVDPDAPLEATYLIGMVGRDDISFLEYDADPNAELIDRSLLPGDAQHAKLIGNVRPRRSRRAGRDMGVGITQIPGGVLDSRPGIPE